MDKLYEALIDGIPGEERVVAAVRGRYQSFVEAEGGAGLASLILPESHKPYENSLTFPAWEGRSLRDLASMIVSEDTTLAALGCAAINAWYNRDANLRALGAVHYPPESDEGDAFRTLEPFCAGKLVSTIGHFHGGERLRGYRELRVFEKDPRPGDYPSSMEDSLLPGSDVVIVTGMALTNGAMPHLLSVAQGSYIALSGPSVPMAAIWAEFGVSALFGTTVWDIPGCRTAIECGGHKETWPCMGKAVRYFRGKDR